jgi:hypothetical protein
MAKPVAVQPLPRDRAPALASVTRSPTAFLHFAFGRTPAFSACYFCRLGDFRSFVTHAHAISVSISTSPEPRAEEKLGTTNLVKTAEKKPKKRLDFGGIEVKLTSIPNNHRS